MPYYRVQALFMAGVAHSSDGRAEDQVSAHGHALNRNFIGPSFDTEIARLSKVATPTVLDAPGKPGGQYASEMVR